MYARARMAGPADRRSATSSAAARTALALLVALLAGCSTAPPLTPDPDASTLLDKEFRYARCWFTISPPKGFVAQHLNPQGDQIDFIDPARPGTGLIINFSPGNSWDLDALVESGGFSSPVPWVILIRQTEVSVSGCPARLALYDVKGHGLGQGGLDYRGLDLLVRTHEGLFTLSFTCRAPDWPECERSFRAALASFAYTR